MSRGRGKGKPRPSAVRKPVSPLGQANRASKGKLPEAKKSKARPVKPAPVKNEPQINIPSQQPAYIQGSHANNGGQIKPVGQYDLTLSYEVGDADPTKFIQFQTVIRKTMDNYALQGNWRADLDMLSGGLSGGGLNSVVVSADVIVSANSDEIKKELDHAASYMLPSHRPKLVGRISQIFKPYQMDK